MAYPPSSRQHTDWFRSGVSAFTREEWAVLVRLPGQFVVAVTHAQPVPLNPVGQGLAGIEAIAAGRACSSRLVREIVSAIYLEELGPLGLAAPGTGTSLAALTRCAQAAAQVLARHAGREDADGYLSWLESIVSRVCQAARPGWSGDRDRPLIGDTERALLAALRAAFGR